MTSTFTAACIQNEGFADMDASVAAASALARAARAAGAELICLPEYFSCYKPEETGAVVGPHAEPAHPALAQFRALAGELGAWLLLGSLGYVVYYIAVSLYLSTRDLDTSSPW